MPLGTMHALCRIYLDPARRGIRASGARLFRDAVADGSERERSSARVWRAGWGRDMRDWTKGGSS
jgi:hypothetical protein